MLLERRPQWRSPARSPAQVAEIAGRRCGVQAGLRAMARIALLPNPSLNRDPPRRVAWAAEAPRPIIASAAQATHRYGRVSSNVRPHEMTFMASPSSVSQRAMAFVDGSNLLIEMGTSLAALVRADLPTTEDVSLATQTVTKALREQVIDGPAGPHRVIRRYWFGSIQGSEELLLERQTWLRDAGYEGVLFRKVKGRDEKGVDLAVAREMLMHGFNKNYETAVLVAGDEDYLGLVQDLKRLGRSVVVCFYDGPSLSKKLRLAADVFVALQHPQGVNPTLTGLLQARRAA